MGGGGRMNRLSYRHVSPVAVLTTRWIMNLRHRLGIACLPVCCVLFAQPLVAQPTQGSPPDATIGAALRTQVLHSLERKLSDLYVFPDVAAKIVAALKDHVANKDYDAITSAQQFAQRVTADIQAVANDRHLRVLYGMGGPPGPPSPEERERMRREQQQLLQSRNFAFESVSRLAGNVGYLDLRGFVDAGEAGETAVAAMTFLANS